MKSMKFISFRKQTPKNPGLSDYLDGVTNESERALLESRLVAEPELKEELDQLAAIKRTVASFEDVPAPRSFALGPEFAAATVRKPMLPMVSRMAFSAAGVGLLVAAFATIAIPSASDQLSLASPSGAGQSQEASLAPQPTSGPPESADTALGRAADEAAAPAADDGATEMNDVLGPDAALGASGLDAPTETEHDFAAEESAKALDPRGEEDGSLGWRLTQILGLGLAATLLVAGGVVWQRSRSEERI